MTHPQSPSPIADEVVEAAAIAIDALWSEGQDRGPAFEQTEREYQDHCRSTARAALKAAALVSPPTKAGAVRLSDLDAVNADIEQCMQAHPTQQPRGDGVRVTEVTAAEIDDAVRYIRLGWSAGVADEVNIGAALRRFVAARSLSLEQGVTAP